GTRRAVSSARRCGSTLTTRAGTAEEAASEDLILRRQDLLELVVLFEERELRLVGELGPFFETVLQCPAYILQSPFGILRLGIGPGEHEIKLRLFLDITVFKENALCTAPLKHLGIDAQSQLIILERLFVIFAGEVSCSQIAQHRSRLWRDTKGFFIFVD